MSKEHAESIVLTEFCGRDAVVAGNGRLEMTVVPAWGSNLVRLRYLDKDLDLLRVPESEQAFWGMPFLYGVPILFPPNRIEDGTFTYNGRTYTFKLNEPETNTHSHGIVFEEAWRLVSAKVVDGGPVVITEFDSTRYPEAFRQFPHPLTLTMEFRLEGATLHKTAILTNKGDEPFPWGFGYHTTFNFPFRPGGDAAKCRFSVGVSRQWLLTERFLPTGEMRETALCAALNDGVDLTQYSLDDVFEGRPSADGTNDAVLTDEDAGIRVVYRCASPFRHWVLYNGSGKEGYISPEPYTWVTNAPNLKLPADITGVRVLEPGRQCRIESTISVTDLER